MAAGTATRISAEIVSQPTRGRRRGFALEHISNTSKIFKRQVHGAEPFTEKVGVPLLESPATKESSRMQVLSFLFFIIFLTDDLAREGFKW